MPPSGLAIIIGAGPTSGGGIARVLANTAKGNLAVAVLARNADNLTTLCDSIRSASNGGTVQPFPTDTQPANLRSTFAAIRDHKDFAGLPLKVSIYHVKHAYKKPFLEDSPEAFGDSQQVYTTGAFAFAQESLRMIYDTNGGQQLLSETGGQKKGTIIFTGTLAALRSNAEYGTYGASRASVRALAQALGKEHSKYGVHVVHTIANGPIRDEDSQETRTGVRMSAEDVGDTYLWLANQKPALWTSELDLRPAQERY